MISRFNLNRVQPPVRRVLAVDAGSRCLKLLLAQRSFDRLHILKEELIDLQEEGLVSAEELKAHLQCRADGLMPIFHILCIESGKPSSIEGSCKVCKGIG